MSALEKNNYFSLSPEAIALVETSMSTEDAAASPILASRNNARLMLMQLSPALAGATQLTASANSMPPQSPASFDSMEQILETFKNIFQDQAKTDEQLQSHLEEAQEILIDVMQQVKGAGSDPKQLAVALTDGFDQILAFPSQDVVMAPAPQAPAPQPPKEHPTGSDHSDINVNEAILTMKGEMIAATVAIAKTAASQSDNQTDFLTQLQDTLSVTLVASLKNQWDQLQKVEKIQHKMHILKFISRFNLALTFSMMMSKACDGNMALSVFMGPMMVLQTTGTWEKMMDAMFGGIDDPYGKAGAELGFAVGIATVMAVATAGLEAGAAAALVEEEVAVISTEISAEISEMVSELTEEVEMLAEEAETSVQTLLETATEGVSEMAQTLSETSSKAVADGGLEMLADGGELDTLLESSAPKALPDTGVETLTELNTDYLTDAFTRGFKRGFRQSLFQSIQMVDPASGLMEKDSTWSRWTYIGINVGLTAGSVSAMMYNPAGEINSQGQLAQKWSSQLDSSGNLGALLQNLTKASKVLPLAQIASSTITGVELQENSRTTKKLSDLQREQGSLQANIQQTQMLIQNIDQSMEMSAQASSSLIQAINSAANNNAALNQAKYAANAIA